MSTTRNSVSSTTDDTEWVVAAPFRSHLRWLIDSTGVPWRVIALQASVPAQQVRHLLLGRDGRAVRRLRRVCARRLLAITPAQVRTLATTIVPAGTTSARVRRLLRAGLPVTEVARYLAVPVPQVRALASGEATVCLRITEFRAHAACDAHGLSTHPDGERPPADAA